MLKGFGHHVDFLCHDGRLLTDTDPAQVAAVFRILDEYVARAGKQYILSLNSFQLEELKPRLGADFDRIVTDNIALTLKDHSPEEKLLGIQVNFDHEK
jgi:uncharacterized protein YydD (DUF2326 family)